MRKTRMANVLFLICVMAGFLAGCHKQAAPVEVRELAQEEAVPKLTLTPGQKEPQIVGRWSTDGLNVTYVTFPGIYQSLGDGVFYSYPDKKTTMETAPIMRTTVPLTPLRKLRCR